ASLVRSTLSLRDALPICLGHAVYCARPVVGNEPFAVLLPDVLVEQRGTENDLQQMTRRFVETGGHVQILVEPVPEELVSQYGVRSEEHTSELQSRENLVC